MNEAFTPHEPDRREADEPRSRARLLRGAALSAGALVGGGSAAAVLARRAASARSPAQDARILDLVLRLEFLEAAFYADALKQGKLRGELREFAEVVESHERAHVAFLRKALGSKASPKPKFSFRQATRVPGRFTATAIRIEDTVVGAYNGQATNLTPATLAAAAKIVSVEARHAAWIRDIAGKPPAAKPTDTPLTEGQVRTFLERSNFFVT